MKNLAIRSFVLALALVGFGATSITSSANAARTLATSGNVQVQTNIVGSPAPVCAPGSTCGMD